MRIFLAILLSVFAFAATASADLESDYRKARVLLDILRRNDPEIKSIQRWEELAKEFRRISNNSKSTEVIVGATFNLGRLYERIYLNRSFRPALGKAVYFYEVLARDYSGHRLADDALLYLGDLRRDELKDEAAARAAYYEIVDTYPNGDQYKLAVSRLKSDRPGESLKSREVSQPKELPKLSKEEDLEKESDSSGILGFLKEVVEENPKAKKKKTQPLVVIDPGHGGDDLGTVNPDGVLEKDVVLAISIFLEEMIRERLRARTFLTRLKDMPIDLPSRTKLANEMGADLFVSIHANATESHKATGIETYYLDNTNDKSSLKLAAKENQAYQGQMSDLSFMLSDLIQNAKLPESISLAHHIQDELTDNVGRYFRDVRNLGVKKAPFFVLVGAHMPCALVEVSFLDHKIEGRRLAERRYQKLVAEGLYRGIRAYFEKDAS